MERLENLYISSVIFYLLSSIYSGVLPHTIEQSEMDCFGKMKVEEKVKKKSLRNICLSIETSVNYICITYVNEDLYLLIKYYAITIPLLYIRVYIPITYVDVYIMHYKRQC